MSNRQRLSVRPAPTANINRNARQLLNRPLITGLTRERRPTFNGVDSRINDSFLLPLPQVCQRQRPIVVRSIFLPSLARTNGLLQVRYNHRRLVGVRLIVATPSRVFAFCHRPIRSRNINVL